MQIRKKYITAIPVFIQPTALLTVKTPLCNSAMFNGSMQPRKEYLYPGYESFILTKKYLNKIMPVKMLQYFFKLTN